MSMEEWLTSSLDSVHEVDILVTEKNEILKNWVEGKDILEVGCGTGNFVQYLVDKGYRVIATDILEN
jgi:2-polyprenyl-3-methyl-5-hydroxy-6-metoxy-1,4-benzoquinol methylase